MVIVQVPASYTDSYITDPVDSAEASGGWLLFAGLMFYFSGIWAIFEGLLALFRSSYFVGHAVFGELWFWALLWMLAGVLELGVGTAIMTQRSWGRWVGIVLVALHALVAMITFATYPWWSAIVLGVDFAILFGLAVRWKRPALA